MDLKTAPIGDDIDYMFRDKARDGVTYVGLSSAQRQRLIAEYGQLDTILDAIMRSSEQDLNNAVADYSAYGAGAGLGSAESRPAVKAARFWLDVLRNATATLQRHIRSASAALQAGDSAELQALQGNAQSAFDSYTKAFDAYTARWSVVDNRLGYNRRLLAEHKRQMPRMLIGLETGVVKCTHCDKDAAYYGNKSLLPVCGSICQNKHLAYNVK